MSTPTERKIADRIFASVTESPDLSELYDLLELAAQEGYYTGTRNALLDHRMDDGAFNRTLRRLERVKARMPRKQARTMASKDFDAPAEETAPPGPGEAGYDEPKFLAYVRAKYYGLSPLDAPGLDEDAVNPLPADDSYQNGSVGEDRAVARAEQYYRRTTQEYWDLPKHQRIPGAPLRDTLRWMIRNGAKV